MSNRCATGIICDGPWDVHFDADGGKNDNNQGAWTTTYYKSDLQSGTCFPVPSRGELPRVRVSSNIRDLELEPDTKSYKFCGWYTLADGQGTQIVASDGCHIYPNKVNIGTDFLSSLDSGSYTLYADWEEVSSGDEFAFTFSLIHSHLSFLFI